MNGGKRPLGYTVVEVMIVLAVSGLMFGVAANFINGRQAKSSFSSGVNELASRVQGTINDVTDGHYSGAAFDCRRSGAGIAVGSSSGTQGTHDACVFLGKVLHFSKGPASNNYEVFSLAAAREYNSGGVTLPVTDLLHTSQKVITDLTTDEVVPQKLDVEDMVVFNAAGAAQHFYGIGFIQGLGSLSTTTPGDTTYAAGAQTTAMIYAPILSHSSTAAATTVVEGIGTGLVSAQKAYICLTDGVRRATIIVGSNNSQLNIDVKMGQRLC